MAHVRQAKREGNNTEGQVHVNLGNLNLLKSNSKGEPSRPGCPTDFTFSQWSDLGYFSSSQSSALGWRALGRGII